MSTNFKKTLAAFVLVAVTAFAVKAPVAKAATMEELQALIASLQAQLAALTGSTSTTTACYNHTVTLKRGSTGSQVSAMQAVVGASTDGNFGPMTEAKVKAFQASKGLTADGIVGSMTGLAIHNAGCSTTPTTPTTGPTTVSGGAGTVDEYKLLSSPSNNEEVGEGQNNVKVLGFSIEADDNSDLGIKAIKLDFAQGTANHDFHKYADSVSVWFGSTKVAEVDATDFDDDNGYAQTVSLTGTAVVEAGEKANFYVAISGQDNIDTPDIGDTWTLDVTSVRWMDGQGGLIAEDPVLAVRTFSFASFETANDLELNIRTASDNPDSQVVQVDDVNDTDNVTLLKGVFEVTGGDLNLQDIEMTITKSSTISGVAKNFTLVVDGEEVDSINSSDCDSTSTCTFSDADFTLAEGDTDFEIIADLNDTGGTFAEGDYLAASINSANVANLMTAGDVEDENGDDVTNVTGAANGKNQIFYVAFPQISVVSSSIVANDNGSSAPTSATANMRVKVVAKGGTILLNGDDESTAAKEFFTIAADAGGNSSVTIASYQFTPSGTYTPTNNGADNEYYTVNENDTMYIDVQAIVSKGNGGSPVLSGMKASAILFGTDTTSDTTRSINPLSYTVLTDMLKTGRNVTLN